MKCRHLPNPNKELKTTISLLKVDEAWLGIPWSFAMHKKTPDKRLLSIQAKDGGQMLGIPVGFVLHAFCRLNGGQTGLYSYEICSWRDKLF